MAVNEKSNVVIQPYNRSNVPQLDVDLRKYIQDELQRLEASIRSMNTAGIEVLDEPPLNPVRGMVKYNITPWDALGNGSQGLIVYNGTAWVAV
jgi:hypothetical protein